MLPWVHTGINYNRQTTLSEFKKKQKTKAVKCKQMKNCQACIKLFFTPNEPLQAGGKKKKQPLIILLKTERKEMLT